MPKFKNIPKSVQKRYEKCVKEVSSKQKKSCKRLKYSRKKGCVNPFAVCYTSVVKKHRKKK